MPQPDEKLHLWDYETDYYLHHNVEESLQGKNNSERRWFYACFVVIFHWCKVCDTIWGKINHACPCCYQFSEFTSCHATAVTSSQSLNRVMPLLLPVLRVYIMLWHCCIQFSEFKSCHATVVISSQSLFDALICSTVLADSSFLLLSPTPSSQSLHLLWSAFSIAPTPPSHTKIL